MKVRVHNMWAKRMMYPHPPRYFQLLPFVGYVVDRTGGTLQVGWLCWTVAFWLWEAQN